jgi:hypothetical protein
LSNAIYVKKLCTTGNIEVQKEEAEEASQNFLEEIANKAPSSETGKMLEKILKKKEPSLERYKKLLDLENTIDRKYIEEINGLLGSNSNDYPHMADIFISFSELGDITNKIQNLSSMINQIIDQSQTVNIVKDSQIEELNRNTFQLTFAAAMEEYKWQLCQTVTATNWKDVPETGSGEEWKKGRIADFFICTNDWTNTNVGLTIPPFVSKGVMLADTFNLLMSRHWLLIADHLPIAGYFSGVPGDNKFKTEIMKYSSDNQNIPENFADKGYFAQLQLEKEDYISDEMFEKLFNQ